MCTLIFRMHEIQDGEVKAEVHGCNAPELSGQFDKVLKALNELKQKEQEAKM